MTRIKLSPLLVVLALMVGCGTTRTVTTTTHARPTAAQVKEKTVAEAAQAKQAAATARREAREAAAAKRREERTEREEHAREAAARHRTEAKERSEKEAEARTEREHEYPAQVQHNFIVGCTAQESTESQCRCLLKKVEAHDSLEQFAAIEEAMRANVPLPAGFTKYAEECRGG